MAVAARERLRPDVEVLGDGEGGKHVVELGDEAEPAPRESVGTRPVTSSPPKATEPLVGGRSRRPP